MVHLPAWHSCLLPIRHWQAVAIVIHDAMFQQLLKIRTALSGAGPGLGTAAGGEGTETGLPPAAGGERAEAAAGNWPSPAIHSLQPRPQAFGSPVARIKTIGSFLTFASRRSISLGSSLAAMEIAGMQQSAATTNRVNSRVTMMVSYERIFRIAVYSG